MCVCVFFGPSSPSPSTSKKMGEGVFLRMLVILSGSYGLCGGERGSGELVRLVRREKRRLRVVEWGRSDGGKRGE